MDVPGELINRIGQGDKLAEQEFAKQFWRPLYFITLRQCTNPSLAQDIVQDALILSIKKARIGEITNPAGIVSFLRSTAQNLLIDHFRKESRRETETSDNIDINFADISSDVFHNASQQELFELVVQVVDELPMERDRKLLNYYYVQGLSKTSVCARLAISDEHFDRVIYRAKQRLKQALLIKFQIDPAKQSLSSMLFCTLLFLLYTSNQENFTNDVRENETRSHYENNFAGHVNLHTSAKTEDVEWL